MSTPRRRFLLWSGASLVMSTGRAAKAQLQPGSPRIAYIWMYSYGPSAPFPDAFRTRLKELGWIEGRNIVVEIHDGEGSPEKLTAIVQDLVNRRVNVIVGACTPEGKAAIKVTKTIPIVMAATGDPVAAGLADSFAHPGHNVTGLSAMLLELSAKRLDLLKEAFPQVTHAAVIFNPERPDNLPEVAAMQAAARRRGVVLDEHPVRSRKELGDALATMTAQGTQALLNAGDTLVGSNAQVLVDYAASRRIPALFENREFVDKGGLMSYGPNFPALHRRAAEYVDKILKGAQAGDLPIEQPTRFELVLNAGTAKKLGFVIPQSLLVQADEIVA